MARFYEKPKLVLDKCLRNFEPLSIVFQSRDNEYVSLELCFILHLDLEKFSPLTGFEPVSL